VSTPSQAEQAEKAVADLEAALESHPEDLELRNQLAAALRDRGSVPEAVEMYRTVAEVYRSRGQIDQALVACNALLATDPGHTAGLRLKAELASLSSSLEARSLYGTWRGLGPLLEARDTQPQNAASAEQTDAPVTETAAPVEQNGTPEPRGASGRIPLPALLAGGAGSEASALTPAALAAEPEEDDLVLPRAFDQPFAQTLSALSSEHVGAAVSLFPGLPDEALAEMARSLSLENYRKGELILREGEAGDACFVIVSGTVRVLKRDPLEPRADLIEVTRLCDGDLFGEFALLADRRRHATVQAVEETQVYRVPRRLIVSLSHRYPNVAPHLERYYRERLLSTLLATAPFFTPLPRPRRVELLTHFEPRRVESADCIILEGQRTGGFYLIVLGSVEISKRVRPEREVLVATLGEGAYFGEMSLLRGDVARATVRAAGPVELAVLPPRDFYRLIADHPVLWEQIRREAHRREVETYELLAGVTGVV
jgi:CRP-like cAMP-binding protein